MSSDSNFFNHSINPHTAPQIYVTFFRLEATKLEHNDALS